MLANAFQYAREQRIAVVAPDFPNLEKENSLVNSDVLHRFISSLANQSTDVFFVATTKPEFTNTLSRRIRFNKAFTLS